MIFRAFPPTWNFRSATETWLVDSRSLNVKESPLTADEPEAPGRVLRTEQRPRDVKEVDEVERSLTQDRRRKAKSIARPGREDRRNRGRKGSMQWESQEPIAGRDHFLTPPAPQTSPAVCTRREGPAFPPALFRSGWPPRRRHCSRPRSGRRCHRASLAIVPLLPPVVGRPSDYFPW